MKKILNIVVVLGVVALGAVTYKYYNETYRATEAYAVVPKEVPEKTVSKDMSGRVIKEDGSELQSYNYTFEFVTNKGEKRQLTYELSSVDPTPYQPGTYVQADVSQKRIVKGPRVVEASQVPDDIKQKLVR